MSISTLLSSINSARRDVADLEKKIGDEKKKEAQNLSKINQIQKNITKNTSSSMVLSRMSQIVRLHEENAKVRNKQADLSKRLATITGDFNRYEQQLFNEQERERKKVEDAQKRREREQLEHQRALTIELETQKRIVQEANVHINSSVTAHVDTSSFDVFISHASEDKEEFVRPLAEALEQRGNKVWYDEFTFKIGDSLRRSIDLGLAKCRYGVVVLSSSFFKKNWTNYELDGLVAREVAGVKVILAIWHKITINEIMQYSPSLADKYAFNTSLMSIDKIADELAEFLK